MRLEVAGKVGVAGPARRPPLACPDLLSLRGARVHSDSWGTESGAYDDLALDFDTCARLPGAGRVAGKGACPPTPQRPRRPAPAPPHPHPPSFAWRNPDFLPVVAAGNAGAAGADGTVSSPAVSKNCLAVGATLAPPYAQSPEFESVAARAPGEALLINVTGAGTRPGGGAHRALAAAYGPKFATALAGAAARRLLAAAPADACAPLVSGPAWAGALVLALRGNCSFAAKAREGGRLGGDQRAACFAVLNGVKAGAATAAPSAIACRSASQKGPSGASAREASAAS